MANVTKTTEKGIEKPEYAPMVRSQIGNRGARILTAEEAIRDVVSLARVLNVSENMIEPVESIADLLSKSVGHQVMVRSSDITKFYDLLNEVRVVEIDGKQFTSHQVDECSRIVRNAVKRGKTRDLGLMNDEKWNLVGYDGIFTSSTGKIHLADNGKSKCGSAEANNVRRDVHILEDFDQHDDRCDRCIDFRAFRRLGLR